MVEAVDTRARPAPSDELRNLIAIASGKGGGGKTWLSITLCHALARAGQRTLLFDRDPALAHVFAGRDQNRIGEQRETIPCLHTGWSENQHLTV